MKRAKSTFIWHIGLLLAACLVLAPDCRAEYFWAPHEYSDDFFFFANLYYPVREDGSVGLPSGPPAWYKSGSLDAIAVGDMDGDGDNDLLLKYHDGGRVLLFSNNGDGTFTGKVVASDIRANSLYYRTLNVGDFNGDGRLDFAVVNGLATWVTRQLIIYLQNAEGGFEISSSTNITHTTGYYNLLQTIHVGDMTGDGADDIVLLSIDRSAIYLCVSDGEGGFAPPLFITESFGTGSNYIGVYSPGLALLDVDNDGDLDIIYGGGRSPFRPPPPMRFLVTLNNGTGQFTPSPTPLIEFPRINIRKGTLDGTLETADFNHDGLTDLIVNRVDTNTIEYLRNNGSGLPSPFDDPVIIQKTFYTSYFYPVVASRTSAPRTPEALIETMIEQLPDAPITIFTNLNHAATLGNKLSAVLDLLNSIDETTSTAEKLDIYRQALAKMENDLEPKICGSTSKKKSNTWLFEGEEQAALCDQIQKIVDALQKTIDTLSAT